MQAKVHHSGFRWRDEPFILPLIAPYGRVESDCKNFGTLLHTSHAVLVQSWSDDASGGGNGMQLLLVTGGNSRTNECDERREAE